MHILRSWCKNCRLHICVKDTKWNKQMCHNAKCLPLTLLHMWIPAFTNASLLSFSSYPTAKELWAIVVVCTCCNIGEEAACCTFHSTRRKKITVCPTLLKAQPDPFLILIEKIGSISHSQSEQFRPLSPNLCSLRNPNWNIKSSKAFTWTNQIQRDNHLSGSSVLLLNFSVRKGFFPQ